jgi:hypothetical protein
MTQFTQLTLALTPGLHVGKAAALFRRIEPGWQTEGACIDAPDADAWFPAASVDRHELVDVLVVCQSCPVRRSCLAAGLLGHERGIWGGTTEDERHTALGDLNAGAPVDAVLDRLQAADVDPSERGAA